MKNTKKQGFFTSLTLRFSRGFLFLGQQMFIFFCLDFLFRKTLAGFFGFEFSCYASVSQRVIVEVALVEYLKKYGYADEVDRLLNRS